MLQQRLQLDRGRRLLRRKVCPQKREEEENKSENEDMGSDESSDEMLEQEWDIDTFGTQKLVKGDGDDD